MKKIKGVIFDMDGVLIDAKDWHYEALNRALSLFCLEIGRYDHLSVYDGLPTKQKLEMLSLERGLPRELHQFINELKQKHTIDLIHQHCHPIFQHEYALSRLQAEGYKLAVCSNSIRQTVQLMLSKAALTPYLEFFLSNQDVEKGKPNPEMYEVAIARLGLDPKECLILEDNENGIKAAYAADAHVMKIETVSDVNYFNIMRAIGFVQESSNA